MAESASSGRLAGVALVTGAAAGIGLAVVRALMAEGVAVAAVDLDFDGLAALESEAAQAGARLLAVPADVSEPARVEAAVELAEQELGPIGILVNVAGILRPGRVTELEDKEWAETFAVNTSGVFYLSRAVVRRMIPRRAGAVVTVASNAAGVPRAGLAAYAASKAAASMFTKCLGLEVAGYGIRCNVVAPGSTDTAMQRALWDSAGAAASAAVEGDPRTFRVGIPLGRIADPADIADAVLFLASDRARHITMHDLYVDGGATLRA